MAGEQAEGVSSLIVPQHLIGAFLVQLAVDSLPAHHHLLSPLAQRRPPRWQGRPPPWSPSDTGTTHFFQQRDAGVLLAAPATGPRQETRERKHIFTRSLTAAGRRSPPVEKNKNQQTHHPTRHARAPPTPPLDAHVPLPRHPRRRHDRLGAPRLDEPHREHRWRKAQAQQRVKRRVDRRV